ncbi:heat shock protein HspQ [Hasllibacter halocynthiae]|uniref:Heat shock protein HspQ n=1 Tax=Hasllibacter halocynthiae TaxID=595589 RepID=A0A2T0X1D9_9RHOB|nr:heat shock protein HspQ [Hasllibacter halocynthiae]PRY92762.1 heat shock protein HspQ [Hasllibacter halocynthiae]
MLTSQAKYAIGQVVRHRNHPFRGVIFDVDPVFASTEEWYAAIPEARRPRKDQPFYHLLAENERDYYVAYVSEQNLVRDEAAGPVGHPDVADLFGPFDGRSYRLGSALN